MSQISVHNGLGILDPTGVTDEQRALLGPRQTQALDKLIAAVEEEARIAFENKGMPTAMHEARLRLARAKKHLAMVRPPMSQADLMRQQQRQDWINRGVTPPDGL
jgi:hypothetical protein